MAHHSIRISRSLIIAAAGVLLVAGCSSPSGGDDSGADPDAGQTTAPDDGGTAGGTDGETGIAKEIPATFPASVPLIDGEVAAGLDVGTGWSVVIMVADIAAAYEEATSALEGAGYAEDYSQSSDDGSFGQFQSDEFTVQVTGADHPEYGPSLTYLVVIK